MINFKLVRFTLVVYVSHKVNVLVTDIILNITSQEHLIFTSFLSGSRLFELFSKEVRVKKQLGMPLSRMNVRHDFIRMESIDLRDTQTSESVHALYVIGIYSYDEQFIKFGECSTSRHCNIYSTISSLPWLLKRIISFKDTKYHVISVDLANTNVPNLTTKTSEIWYLMLQSQDMTKLALSLSNPTHFLISEMFEVSLVFAFFGKSGVGVA